MSDVSIKHDDGTPPPTKMVEAFYTRAPSAQPVSLWILDLKTDGAPDFDGSIGGKRVAVWIRHSQRSGSFLSIHAQTKGADDRFPQLGTANVVVNDRGMVRLAIKMEETKEVLWASVSKKAPEDILVRCGLKLDLLAQKRASYEARKAAAAKE